MSVNTASGSTISIGTTAATALTDTYTLVGSVSNAGEFGRIYQLIKFDDIAARGTQKFKGQYDDGAMAVELGRDATDSGQAAMVAARDDDHDYNFKVTLNDASTASGSHPTIFFFKAKVMGYTTNIGTASSVVMAKATIEIKSGTINEIVAT